MHAAEWDEEFDLVVLGSGGAGLTAALVGAIEGLRVLVIERTDQIGGTTAFSSGTLWVPGYSSFAEPAEQQTATQAASTYLDGLVGDKAPRALRETFLAHGPKMMRYLTSHTTVRFRTYKRSPDYYQDVAGASPGGQAHEPMPFDAHVLGRDFAKIRWPIPELMLFGGMMVTRGEAAQLLQAYKSASSAALAVKLIGRYLLDRITAQRGTRLVLGNALVARLLYSLIDRKVDIRLTQQVTALTRDDDTVTGIELLDNGRSRRISALGGVVLAGGGFPADPEWRERYFPHPIAQYTPAFISCVGETIRLALAAGARMGEAPAGNALWFPSSISKRADGSTAVYPHIVLDRSKPGLIAVNQQGMRFTNEAVSYHEFGQNMHRSHLISSTIPAALICDSTFIWKYGLGMIRPMTPNLKKYITNGYLIAETTIEKLAAKLGMDTATLCNTVAIYNNYAATGIDDEFHKGENIYDQSNGDPEHLPNPCIAALEKAPYFSVRIYPTPLGTSLGLAANENAEVMSTEGIAIKGLYSCGNDMNSIMGGHYPGPGAQLGPGMTFAYIAARHASQRISAHGVAKSSPGIIS